MGKQNWPIQAGIYEQSGQNIGMILHHIKPEQFAQLEAVFGKKTDAGLEIPLWLQRLRETAAIPPKDKDFEPTEPQVGELQG